MDVGGVDVVERYLGGVKQDRKGEGGMRDRAAVLAASARK